MPRNKMSDLRNHLFEALERLKDEEKPMDLARARAISEVAQAIINSAKVEVDMVKAIGISDASEFFDQATERRQLPVPRPLLAKGGAGR